MNKGFTLVETLIVVGIITVILGITDFSYRNYSQHKRFERDVEAFVSVVTLAREKSVARDIGTYTCPTFGGYQVVLGAMATGYRLDIRCAVVETVQMYALTDSTVQNAAPVSIDFFYGSLGMLTAPVTLKFKNNSIAECRNVTISQTGVITMSDTYTSGC